MRLIITGSRPPRHIVEDSKWLDEWHDTHLVDFIPIMDRFQEKYPLLEIEEVITGGGPGWDRVGEMWQEMNSATVPVLMQFEYPERWANHQMYGRLDLVQRNQAMTAYANGEGEGAALVVWAGLTSGTLNMVYECGRAGLLLEVEYWEEED